MDIGSRFIKGVVFDCSGHIIIKNCIPIKGQIRDCLQEMLLNFSKVLREKPCLIRSITGFGCEPLAKLYNLKAANDILSAQLGTLAILPEANSILEIGGEHAKFVRLTRSQPNNEALLCDFFKNSICSAGTGGFLEQEIHRLGLTIAKFGDLAARSRKLAHVSGRCCVFAKTDIVHQHQNGASIEDVAYALCYSVAQNIINELIANRKFQTPLALIGGVALNTGVFSALAELLSLDKSSLIVPKDAVYASCIGAYISTKTPDAGSIDIQQAKMRLESWHPMMVQGKSLPPLVHCKHHSNVKIGGHASYNMAEDYIAGFDIGSTSTNLVCLSPSNDVIEYISMPTRGRAFTAATDCISALQKKLGGFRPRSVAITGSGKNLIGKLIGADLIVNEITAHATAAGHFLENVDTIFDIGGQDSKYARLENGCLNYFDMNKVCSAGTGSFLEEMAGLMGLDIINEFPREALSSKNPVDLGERCTIFMSSELVRRLHMGYSRADLAAGLCYSVVNNYRYRVIGRRSPGKIISFQGGVAGNAAIVAAMENIFQCQIYVHPYHEIAGAVGAALLASKSQIGKTNFRGLPDGTIYVKIKSFECARCGNNCQVYFSRDNGTREILSDGLCERYSDSKERHNSRSTCKKVKPEEPDLFEERRRLLIPYINDSKLSNSELIGIPNSLIFHEMAPFWYGFFDTLGIPYKYSPDTSRDIVRKGMSACHVKTCFSMKIGYGHCQRLIDDGFKSIFLPSIGNLSFGTVPERLNHICPAVQAWPFMAKSIFPKDINFLTPTFRFAISAFLKRDAIDFARKMGAPKKQALAALQNGLDSQAEFFENMQLRGKEIFSGLEWNRQYAVLLSRPYIYADSFIQLRLKKVFASCGIIPIPLEMCPALPQSRGELSGMYWYFGRKFLQIAKELRMMPDISFVFLNNFSCGSDSFIIHFLRETLRDTPFLELEIDEHSEFTGLATRLEAFADSIRQRKSNRRTPAANVMPNNNGDWKNRKLLLPRMSDHAEAFAAALRNCGVDASVMPLSNNDSNSLGKMHVVGQECLPCTMIVGDMLNYLNNNGSPSSPPAFFMISGDGPCRLGQYPYLQRQILDECGYSDIPIFDASQDQSFYDKLGSLSRRFKAMAWEGSIATDLLFRKWRQCRPYASDIQAIDDIYDQELHEISRCIEANTNMSRQLKQSFAKLESLMPGRYIQRPVIGLLGENYVRCNSAANRNIANAPCPKGCSCRRSDGIG